MATVFIFPGLISNVVFTKLEVHTWKAFLTIQAWFNHHFYFEFNQLYFINFPLKCLRSFLINIYNLENIKINN